MERMDDVITIEDGADEISSAAIDRYEEHFKKQFPFYNYLDMTSDENYMLSVSGAKRLSKFIDERIKKNKPVYLPPDYAQRLY